MVPRDFFRILWVEFIQEDSQRSFHPNGFLETHVLALLIPMLNRFYLERTLPFGDFSNQWDGVVVPTKPRGLRTSMIVNLLSLYYNILLVTVCCN